ncbi:hypothetical protein K2173_024918 [Erythroxylum novogranatense]|uniref:DUF1764-domain-containing protein n=1 Tax=Erythroxylum novogranatense TaxID=1862640 RepID=A0AAV8UGU6_9ROSI|nr:hypothetical protein K2173_024918 [Erythroxylum novogranatense]
MEAEDNRAHDIAEDKQWKQKITLHGLPDMLVEETSSVSKKAKASSATKKLGNEIDAIFSGKKRKNPDQQPNRSVAEDPKSLKKKQKQKKSREEKEGNFADPPAKSRRKTDDGFTVYTEEELGIHNGNTGGTPLCPFDCDCCFG